MSRSIAITGTAIALIVGSLIGYRLAHVGAAPARAALAAPRPPLAAAAPRVDIPLVGSPSLGNGGAPIVVVEFSDFECPACGFAEPTVERLRAELGDDVRLVWKNFPLEMMHAHARLAAEAALAAGAQGRFWEMHDALFADQRHLDRAAIEAHAEALHLDLDAFRRALDTHAFAAAVDRDAQLAARLGVNGTPTFFVDGRRVARWNRDLLSDVAAARAEHHQTARN